jgi:hypothetical protein
MAKELKRNGTKQSRLGENATVVMREGGEG